MHRRDPVIIALTLALLTSPVAEATLINGDFETGDLTGWQAELVPIGTFGEGFPRVETFERRPERKREPRGAVQCRKVDAVRLPVPDQVRRLDRTDGRRSGGDYRLSADVAAYSTVGNAEAGLFELIFDGNLYYEGATVASVDFRTIAAGATEWAHLSAVVLDVAPGTHSIAVRVSRRFSLSAWSSLIQSVDDVSVVPIPEPEPASMLLAGLSWLAWRRRRRLEARRQVR